VKYLLFICSLHDSAPVRRTVLLTSLIECFEFDSAIHFLFLLVYSVMNKEDAMDHCKWRKMIKDVR